MKFMKQTLAAVALAVSAFTVQAQTADEIIDKHITAIGGADAWRKVNSVVLEGKMTVQGAEVNVVGTTLNGKGSRQDISVMGMNGYTIMTPTGGWSYMPFQGQQKAEPVTEDQVKEGADQLDAQGALVDYKTKGHTVELLGKEDVEGTECYKLKVKHKSGKEETIFMDPTSYYIVKSVSKVKANGQEAEMATTMSNYKKLPEGIVMPMTINIPMGPGMNAEMNVTKIEINKAVDEAIFKPSN